jgi:hypothetical protein
LRNIWLQNATFTLVALFSIVVLTQPRVSALVLAVFLFIAIAASLIFERRAFCRYLCPVGGFIGLYSQVAPVELRVVDTAVCAAHTEKSCYVGNDEGFGCPWQVYPGGLTKNTYCGTCMECLRTCPHDNIAINLRAFGDDLLVASGRKMDEAFKSFLMLGSALIYCAVLLGPWGALKSAAYSVGSLSWVVYAMTFLAIVFGLLPALFLLSVIAGGALSGASKSHISQPGSWLKSHRKTYIAFAYALVPLGLAAWVAFSLSFVFTNLSYLWPALSDPLGWGWDLFHTASVNWTPYLSSWLPVMQVIVLLVGLVWASRVAVRIAHQHITSERLPRDVSPTRLALPVVAFCLALTAGLLALLVA